MAYRSVGIPTPATISANSIACIGRDASSATWMFSSTPVHVGTTRSSTRGSVGTRGLTQQIDETTRSLQL